MIIKEDHLIFDHLYWLLFTSRGDENHKKSFSCTILSAILASHLLKFQNKVFIIDSSKHSVVYDGTSTWDLALGIVFVNYKYPSLNIPNAIFIPKFKRFYKENLFNDYYSDESLLSTKNISIKKVEVDGTKKKTS